MASTVVSVPKYRRHRGSQQAFVQLQGRRHYLGKWNSPQSKERYARFVAELAVRPATTPALPPPSHDLTIVELCAAFLDFAQGYYVKNGKPTGWLHHIKMMLRMLRDTYGHTPAAEFGPLAFKAIRQKLIDAGHSRSYINKVMAIVPRIFKWGAAEELIPASVYQALRTVEGIKRGRTGVRETAPVQPVADDVVDATLSHLPVVVADMVRLQRLTGARPGEVCQIRPMDVDRSGEVWQYRPESHKTQHHDRERIIYIGPQAQNVLRPYLLRAADAYCFSPAESEVKRHVEQRARRRSRVQPSQRNRRKARPKRQPQPCYTKDSYGRALQRGIVKANREAAEVAATIGADPVLIPHWHLNQLRHSAATQIRRQFGLEAAQVILGHATANVSQIYAERDSGLAVNIMRRIG